MIKDINGVKLNELELQSLKVIANISCLDIKCEECPFSVESINNSSCAVEDIRGCYETWLVNHPNDCY